MIHQVNNQVKESHFLSKFGIPIIFFISLIFTSLNALSQHGLNYQYFEGNFSSIPNFNKLKPQKSGKVSNFSLSPKKRENKFAFVFEGFFEVSNKGRYRFYLVSDDGSRLFIKNKLTVNNNSSKLSQENSGTVYLDKGRHPIRVDYFDKKGRHRLTVMADGPGFKKRKLRKEDLYLSNTDQQTEAPIAAPTGGSSSLDPTSASGKVYKNQVFSNGPQFILREEDSGTQFINCTFKNYTKGTAIRIEGAENILIRGCKFINITNNEIGRDAHAIECNRKGKNIIVEDSYFKNLGADGLQLGHEGTDIRNWIIRNNEFMDCGENGVDIKQVQGNILLQNNYFSGSMGCPKGTQEGCTGDPGTGVIVHRGAKGVEINGNVFYDNMYGLRVAKGVKNEPPVDILVKNNFFHKNAKFGLHVMEADYTMVYNNSFLDNAGYNLRINLRSGQRIINRNNLFIGRGGKSMESDGKGNMYYNSLEQAGMLLSNGWPQLKSNSPAINQGVNITQVTNDIYLTSRPQAGSLDCGAVEFNGSTNARILEETKEKSSLLAEENESSLNTEDNLPIESDLPTLDIFPNPASEQIHFVLSGTQTTAGCVAQLTNLQGRVLWQDQLMDQQEIMIPASHLQDGIYLLQVEGSGVKLSQKVIIKH